VHGLFFLLFFYCTTDRSIDLQSKIQKMAKSFSLFFCYLSDSSKKQEIMINN
jgi:hypothetical protein